MSKLSRKVGQIIDGYLALKDKLASANGLSLDYGRRINKLVIPIDEAIAKVQIGIRRNWLVHLSSDKRIGN